MKRNYELNELCECKFANLATKVANHTNLCLFATKLPNSKNDNSYHL